MTVKDVADLLFAARERRVDFYWTFHVVVVTAVIGWLVSRKSPLAPPMKALVSVAYAIAAATNFLGLYSSYTFAEALRTDLLRMTAATPLTDTRLVLAEFSYLPQRLAALGIHLALGSAILLAIWLARPARPESPRANPRAGKPRRRSGSSTA
jgi:hypothetical protein